MIFSTKTDLRISAFLVLIEPFYFKIKGSHALFDKTFLNLRSNKRVNQKRRVKRFWHFAPETRPSTALHMPMDPDHLSFLSLATTLSLPSMYTKIK